MALSSKTIRIWSFVHKWSSLVSTAFLLMLCLTGLPLIFHDEIESQLHPFPASSDRASAPVSIDSIVRQASVRRLGERVNFVFFDRDVPMVTVATAAHPDAEPEETWFQSFDLRSGEFLPRPQPTEGFMYVMLRLHVDMFADLKGTLFLGVMGLLLIVAIISGVVLYAPFMRKMQFGTIRSDRTSRTLWLDLHNLLGIVTVTWLLVVGITGVVNTLGKPVEWVWQANELSDMLAPFKHDAVPVTLASVDSVVAAAREAVPNSILLNILFPESAFTGPNQFLVVVAGDTPLTGRLIRPILVNANTGRMTETREMPWYVKTLFVSQPLHFGDYGGLPLKVIWALLNIATIVVLLSGLYLWLKKRNGSRAGANGRSKATF